MNNSLFLDTTVFFDSIDDTRNENIINHGLNIGYSLQTSITVIGEAFTQMRENRDRDQYIPSFVALLDQWNVNILYPNDMVRILCFIMGDEEIDTRIIREITDRTHLAYAMAYRSDYFLTSDKNLKGYHVPKKLIDEGFNQPTIISLQEFKDLELSKR